VQLVRDRVHEVCWRWFERISRTSHTACRISTVMISAKKIEPRITSTQWTGVKPSAKASNSRTTRICQPTVSAMVIATIAAVSAIGMRLAGVRAFPRSVRARESLCKMRACGERSSGSACSRSSPARSQSARACGVGELDAEDVEIRVLGEQQPEMEAARGLGRPEHGHLEHGRARAFAPLSLRAQPSASRSRSSPACAARVSGSQDGAHRAR
jgi:hypothetical protein